MKVTNKKFVSILKSGFLGCGILLLGPLTQSHGTTLGYADVVIEYFNSGTGPIDVQPYGILGNDAPVPVSTDVVLGDDSDGLTALSLPAGSFVTVGFTDETIVDGEGDDIFIQEEGAASERAEVYVSANGTDFELLGIADGGLTTSLDLASIGFEQAVVAVKIIGLDSLGLSPGFDVVNVRVLPGSIGDAPPGGGIGGGGIGGGGTEVPEPGTLLLLGAGLLAGRRKNKTS